MTVKMVRRAAATVGATWFVALMTAQNASAAGAEKVGKNIGDGLHSIGVSLFTVTGIIALALLVSRKMAAFVVFGGAAIIAGGFIFADDIVANVIRAVWSTVGRGV